MKTEKITISKEFAYECATALVYKHNAIPQDKAHDNVIIVSYRELYKQLCELRMQFMIAEAIKPINPNNLPLFIK